VSINLIDTGRKFFDFPIKYREDMFGKLYYITDIKSINDAVTLSKLWIEEEKLSYGCAPRYNVFGEKAYSIHILNM